MLKNSLFSHKKNSKKNKIKKTQVKLFLVSSEAVRFVSQVHLHLNFIILLIVK